MSLPFEKAPSNIMNVYNNTRWRKARLTYLQRNPFCVMCREQGRYEPATAVDHIIPHKLEQALIAKDQVKIRNAQKLFWDSSNWQGLCNTHHSSTKQRIENRGTEIGCDINGMPYGGHWSKEK